MNAKRKWDRTSYFYDLWAAPMEMMGGREWRPMLFSELPGGRILEIGVGTGVNFEYYPDGARDYTGIDISPKMLAKARARADRLGKKIELLEMDAGDLKFPDNSFDAVFTTCVLCSVPDAIGALREMRRVLKKDGTAIFLEHMRPDKGLLGIVFDMMNPLTSRLIGFNVNRRTVGHIREAGFGIIEERHLLRDIFRYLKARP
ncbi:MAG: class I SAM-dependent methyltransferase [Spirochaetes bacterium]|nr:MAG: class I SAM-dependent methyltransferase [Spirochaetota bacterium]